MIKAFFTSVYSPYLPEEKTCFNQYLNDVFSALLKDTVLFQGQDENVELVVKYVDEYKGILGPHGITARNPKGVDKLTMLKPLIIQT